MASTVFIDNQTTIFADWLNDVNSAVYDGTFPNGSLSLTTLNVTGAVTGAGFTSLIDNALSAPGAIGGATPNTGAFTTLSASTFTTSGLATLNSLSVSGSTTLVAPNLGTPTTLVGTNITGTSNALNAGIAVNQTWQAVTRVSGTTYTNTTGKPITVNIYASQAAGQSLTISVSGTQIGVLASSVNNTVFTTPVLVPPGGTYVITGTFTAIYELR
jgi:hypothetical protein